MAISVGLRRSPGLEGSRSVRRKLTARASSLWSGSRYCEYCDSEGSDFAAIGDDPAPPELLTRDRRVLNESGGSCLARSRPRCLASASIRPVASVGGSVLNFFHCFEAGACVVFHRHKSILKSVKESGESVRGMWVPVWDEDSLTSSSAETGLLSSDRYSQYAGRISSLLATLFVVGLIHSIMRLNGCCLFIARLCLRALQAEGSTGHLSGSDQQGCLATLWR